MSVVGGYIRLTTKYWRRAFSNRSRYWSGGIYHQHAMSSIADRDTHDRHFPAPRQSKLPSTLNRLEQVETAYGIDETDDKLVPLMVQPEQKGVVHDPLRTEVLGVVVYCLLQDPLRVCASARHAVIGQSRNRDARGCNKMGALDCPSIHSLSNSVDPSTTVLGTLRPSALLASLTVHTKPSRESCAPMPLRSYV